MNTSKGRILPALLAALVFNSCGIDGGSRGTGITSTAQGNIASIQTAAMTAEATDLGGIRVTVEESGRHSNTASNGSFVVRGTFEGELKLQFTRADGIHAHTGINLPAGGTLTLNNVHIDNTNGSATPESQDVEFLGKIVEIDCGAQTLELVALRHAATDTDSYTLRLDTSTLRDKQGNALSCADLGNGQKARVQGTVNDDGSFGHAQVVID